MLKGKPKPAADAQSEPPQFKNNPEIDAKIDAYIDANPKYWDYVQSMSPERMARALVLNQVQKQERSERIEKAVIQKLEKNPELKQSYQTIVKNLPAEQQEKAIAQLARKNERLINRKQEAAKPSVRV